MLRRRATTEAQPRTKNGHPPQTTTGVASASWTQLNDRPGKKRAIVSCPTTISDIACASSGADRARQIQNRRLMSTSSGLISSPVAVTGSRAIPQIGQNPDVSRTISGCIGQV